jgi:hypothetical protein
LGDLGGQAAGQILDVVHGFEHALVLEALHVEGRYFADQREAVATVVQVTAEFEEGHRALGRGLREGRFEQVTIGIFGELMHVHDVGQRTELMQVAHEPGAFDAGLVSDQEEDRGADDADGAEGGFQELDEVGQIAHFGHSHVAQRGHDDADDASGQQPAQDADGDVRAAGPIGAADRFFGDLFEFGNDVAKARGWEALFDPALKERDGLNDLGGVQLAVSHFDFGVRWQNGSEDGSLTQRRKGAETQFSGPVKIWNWNVWNYGGF